MKNIVAKLTLRQLKLNKRRTIISIIGIALSVTMLTATASVVTSFLDGMRRGEISAGGEWHTRLDEMPMKNVNKIKSTIPNINEVLMLEWEGFAPIPQNGDMRYFYIEGYSENTFDYFPVTLKEGCLPQNDGELLISDKAAAAGYKIGQSFTLDLGYRSVKHKPDYNKGETDEDAIVRRLGFDKEYREESDYYYEEKFTPTDSKTYTIVGIFSDRARYYTSKQTGTCAYEAISFLDLATIKPDKLVSPLLLFSELNTDIYENTENGGKTLGAVTTSRNSSLLQYYGLSNRDEIMAAMALFIAILVLVIIIGSVAFIYNAFSISLADRSKYLGLLACVGATKKQKRYSVVLEGVVLGAAAIPLGLLAGFGGIAVTLRLITPYLQKLTGTNVDFHLVVHPATVIFSVILGIITIAISLYKPARKASKTSAIEAVRSSNEFKITKKQIKTSRLTKKLFGFEGGLAMKNIKRNKGRYRITVASLAISIVLFLVTVCAVNIAENAYLNDIGYNTTKYNVKFYGDHHSPAARNKELFDDVFNELSASPNTEWISLRETADLYGFVPTSEILNNPVSDFSDMEIITPDEKQKVMRFSVISLDDNEFDRYLKQIGKNPSKYPKDKAVFVNKAKIETYNPETESSKLVKEKLLRNVPDEITLVETIPEFSSSEADKIEAFRSYDGVMNLKSAFKDDTKNTYLGIPTAKIKIGAVTDTPPDDAQNNEAAVIIRENVFKNIIEEYKDIPTQYESFITEIYLKTNNDKISCSIAGDVGKKTGRDIYIENKEESLREAQTLVTLISVFSGGFIALIILICIANIFNTVSTGIMLRRREFAMLKSTGMTPKAFNRMIGYESLFYALKALLYGVPISIIIAVILKIAVANVYETTFIAIFPWTALAIAAVTILLLVGATAFYALRRIKKENIMDVLKDENI